MRKGKTMIALLAATCLLTGSVTYADTAKYEKSGLLMKDMNQESLVDMSTDLGNMGMEGYISGNGLTGVSFQNSEQGSDSLSGENGIGLSMDSSFADMPKIDLSAEMPTLDGFNMDVNFDSLFSSSEEKTSLSMPTLDRFELTDSVKLNANSTLQSLLGDSFDGLDSNLFGNSSMPNVNFESLNVEYASLLSDFESKGISNGLSLQKPDSFGSLSATNVTDTFNNAFKGKDLKSGVSSIDIPSSFDAAAQAMSASSASRNNSYSAWKESDAYNEYNKTISLKTGSDEAKNAAMRKFLVNAGSTVGK